MKSNFNQSESGIFKFCWIFIKIFFENFEHYFFSFFYLKKEHKCLITKTALIDLWKKCTKVSSLSKAGIAGFAKKDNVFELVGGIAEDSLEKWDYDKSTNIFNTYAKSWDSIHVSYRINYK